MKEMKKVALTMILVFLVAIAPTSIAQDAESTFWPSPLARLSAWLSEAVSQLFGDDSAAPEGQNNLAGEEPEFHGYILPGG